MTLTHAEYKAIANNIRPNGQAFIDGKFVKSGGKELALELEEKGYSWLES